MGSQLDKVLIAPNRRDVPRFHGWAKLFRIPNLFTVPGDQLAGYCLAGGLMYGRPLDLVYATGAGLCLYAAGLAINDLVDIHEDATDRPWRPLASGLLDRTKVEWISALLLLSALVLGALGGMIMVSLVGMLMAAVLAYNTLFKNVPVVGEVLMGLCRALSLLLGSVAAMERLPVPDLALVGAAVTMSYIVAVALVARNETRPERLRRIRWLPILLCFCWVLLPMTRPEIFDGGPPYFLVPFLTLGVILLMAVVCIGRHIQSRDRITARRRATLRVSAHVGSMIRALIFVQATLVLIAAPGEIGIWVAGGVAALWLPSTWLGRTIPSS